MSKTLNVKTWAVLLLAGILSTGSAYGASSGSESQTPQATQATGTCVGRVVDETGEGLVGATVHVDGTSIAAAVNIDGEFSLAGVKNGAKITVSYIGYQPVTVTWTGEPLHIVMQPDSNALEEVVVVGYGTQKKVNLTGAVAAVNGDVLENRPITNIGQGLQGVIGNLKVNVGSGAPGATSSFNIRGVTSISSNTGVSEGAPLVLVDNVQMDPNLVNPDDIEQISVLKDGASAAIYGARAAYGVILITTKKGKSNEKPVINFSATAYWANSALEFHRVNSLDYINSYDAANVNAGGSPVWTGTVRQYVEDYFYGRSDSPVYWDPSSDWGAVGGWSYCGNTDWWNELYKTSFNQNYNLSVSGGSGKTTYYASVGLFDQGTNRVGAHEDYKRWNVKLSVNTQITSWLNVGANITNSYVTQKHPTGSANSGVTNMGGMFKNDLTPLMPVRHPDGHYSGETRATHPIAMAELGGTSKWKYNDLWLTGIIQLTPLKGLMLQADYTWNYYNANSVQHATSYLEYGYEGRVVGYYPWSLPSYVAYSTSNDYYTSFNAFGQYDWTIADKNNFSVMVGYNQEKKVNGGFNARRDDMITNDLWMLNQGTGQLTANSSGTQWAINSLFFRVNYDYDNKYLLTLTGRYDGSSKFPKGHRYGFFPSVQAAWRVSQENFWEGMRSWWSNFKIRATYGRLGNQAVSSNFPYLLAYGINSNYGYIIDGNIVTAVTAPGLVSGDLTWEKVDQMDFGFDAGFFNNRLTAEFDWYSRETKGALVPGQALPDVLGTSVPASNSANIRTNGWELTMGWNDNVSSIGLGYYAKLSLSDNWSTVTKFDNNPGTEGNWSLSYLYPGKRIGEIWGMVDGGLFQSQQEVDDYTSKVDLSYINGVWYPGDVKWLDINDDGVVDDGDWTTGNPGDNKIIGNSQPRYSFGITLGANWKGFDFEMFWQGVGKRDVPWNSALDSRDFYAYANQWATPMRTAMDYWTPENPNAYFARITMGGNNGKNYSPAGNSNTRYLLNLAYGRLKNLMLGYTIPQQITQKAGISKLRLFIQGENLVTISNSKKFCDPETSGYMTYPIQKKFTVGLNLTI